MKKLIVPLLLVSCAASSVFAQAQPATAQPVTPKRPAASLQQLPPPPPVLDQQLRRDLAATRKLDDDQRSTIVNKQKQIDSTLAPLTPEQMLHIQKLARDNERLVNSSVNGPARKLVDRDLPWSVGLGSQQVHIGVGYSTTLLFFDSQGRPVPVSTTPGAIVGDKDAVEANSTGNAVVLYVAQPWRSTNLTVFLQDVPVPVQFSLTSDRASGTPVDGQIRVRIVDSNSANALERGDMQNVNSLLQLTNGAPGSANMSVLPVLSVEKGDPARLNWTPIVNNLAQFRVGPDGLTYVLLKPGFKLLYPNVPNVLSSLRGADGTEGYIVGGNNPRMFTVQDQNGALYRINVQR